MKRIYFVIVAIVSIIYVISVVRKNKFSIKESFWWMMASFVMLVFAIFPKLFDNLAVFLGISYPPSLLFVICIIFLLFINFRNSKRIAEQQEKITELAQNIAILKEKLDKNKKDD